MTNSNPAAAAENTAEAPKAEAPKPAAPAKPAANTGGDLKTSDLPDLKSDADKDEAAKPVAEATDGNPKGGVTQGSKLPSATSARHDAEAKGISNADHDKQTYHEAPKPAPEGPKQEITSDQTKVLLFGCPAQEITRLAGMGEFSTLRVTRKWFDGAEIGDEIEAWTSVRSQPNSNRDDEYPQKGEKIGVVKVTDKGLYPSMSAALEVSKRNNHLCLAGQSKAALEAIIRKVYPDKVLAKAGSDPKEGFTVLTLELIDVEG